MGFVVMVLALVFTPLVYLRDMGAEERGAKTYLKGKMIDGMLGGLALLFYFVIAVTYLYSTLCGVPFPPSAVGCIAFLFSFTEGFVCAIRSESGFLENL